MYRPNWERNLLQVELLEKPLREKSKENLDWLENNKSFRFDSEHGSISLIKDNQGYWTASKKVDGRLRRKRVGRSEDLGYRCLEEAAYILCNYGGWSDYRNHVQEKKKSTTKGLKEQNEYLQERLATKQREIYSLQNKITELQTKIALMEYEKENDL